MNEICHDEMENSNGKGETNVALCRVIIAAALSNFRRTLVV